MSQADEWLKGLNEEQQRAASHIEGPLLILAGAGSGKTTVLVSRTGYLLATGSCRAENLAVLTFTNKAAKELTSRVGKRLGSKARGLWTGTFHSFGLSILRQHYELARLPKGFGILDAGDAGGLLKEIMLNVKNSGKTDFRIEKLLGMMSEWRGKSQTRAQSDDEYEIMCEVLLPKYLKKLEMLGVADFDALLLKPLEIFQQKPEILERLQEKLQFLMVDEFQDTNVTQFELVKKITSQRENLAVVGDDDQSIYGWRGACVDNILGFPKHFKKCEVIRLEMNYRSCPEVLNMANAVIKENAHRHQKVLKPAAGSKGRHLPELFCLENEDDEADEVVRQIRHFTAEGYGYEDMAILYRSNGQSGLMEVALRQNQIPYQVTGGTGFFDRKESRDLLAYLKVVLSLQELPLRRVLNTPPRGLGEVAIDHAVEKARELGVSFPKVFKDYQTADFSPQHVKAIENFWRTVESLKSSLIEPSSESPSQAFIRWVHSSGYRAHIQRLSGGEKGFQGRWVAVEVLARMLERSFESTTDRRAGLKAFLDSMDLREVPSSSENEKEQQVQLMTLHACKGLEFPVVILTGVEEDLLPHRVLGTDLSEERRLFYVGITRAKERLVLTRCQTRRKYGRPAPSAPSRFLNGLAGTFLKEHQGGRILSAESRQDRLKDLMNQLQQGIASQRLE